MKISLFFSILILFLGVRGMQTGQSFYVALIVEPPVVQRGGHAILKCLRDLKETALYSVKLYRGTREFYRYVPTEDTKIKIFESAGITVDTAMSNETQVVLRHVEFITAGNFTCEVTAERPTFTTVIAFKYVDVVALPEYPPVLAPESFEYKAGDILRANCTGVPSRPAANLTFLVNDAMIHPSAERTFKNEDGLQWNEIEIRIHLTDSHFPDEKLTLRCSAQIYEIYADGEKSEFSLILSDPRPEKIMSAFSSSHAASCSGLLLGFIFIFLLLHLKTTFSQIQDFDDFTYSFYDEIFYDDVSENIKTSLIGN